MLNTGVCTYQIETRGEELNNAVQNWHNKQRLIMSEVL